MTPAEMEGWLLKRGIGGPLQTAPRVTVALDDLRVILDRLAKLERVAEAARIARDAQRPSIHDEEESTAFRVLDAALADLDTPKKEER